MNTHLIIIDPQIDFCDPKRGALYVKGAEKDMDALASFITNKGDILDEIHVTLDSHQTLHIAHPIFWKDSNGNHPAPFTMISRQDVESGKWTTTNPKWMAYGLKYVEGLEKNKRYALVIWPPHCLISSQGGALNPSVFDALIGWETKYFAKVNFLVKGSNILTEHYSAVQADRPLDDDETTKLNTAFIDTVKQADRIFLSGEALSHCLKFTVEDVADAFDPENIKKFVLLRDTTSSVTGFEAQGEEFIKNMVKRGMKVMNTTDVKR